MSAETQHPTDCIVNFRDVGETLERLTGATHIQHKVLYRGGRINAIQSHESLLDIPTILNLRTQKNARHFDACYLRAPADNAHHVYDTANKKTRKWLNKALGMLSRPEVEVPVYIHCTSGKDRTGVVVAALLLLCGVDDNVIIAEYLESQGDVDARLIRIALDGMRDVERYFRKVDIELLRRRFLYPVSDEPRV